MAKFLRGIDLPWIFFGRTVRPFHLATVVAMVVVALNNFFTEDTPLASTFWGDIIGAIAVVTACIMMAAWWLKNDALSEWGLLLSGGIWAYRAMLYLLTGEQGHISNWFTAFGLSIAWMIGTCGAWMLERYERHYQEIVRLQRLMESTHERVRSQNGKGESE